MYGTKQWSPLKRRLWRVSSPVVGPVLLGVSAAAIPVLTVAIPAIVASDHWKTQKKITGHSLPRRCRARKKREKKDKREGGC